MHAMDEGDRNSLDALLDEIEHLSDRKDDQRSEMIGSNVHLNVYNMVRQQLQLVSYLECRGVNRQ